MHTLCRALVVKGPQIFWFSFPFHTQPYNHLPQMTASPLQQYLARHQLELIKDSNSNKGRSVVAKEVLHLGSVVITSQPLGTVPLKSHRHEFCNYCFRKIGSNRPDANPLQRCSRCKSAYFCDMICFKNAWLSYHQFVCQPHNGAVNDNDDDEEDSERDLEMLERVALNVSRYNKRKAKMEEEGIQKIQEEEEESVEVTMEAFSSLMDHYHDHPKYLISQYNELAKTALQRPYLADIGLDKQELVRFLCRFRCNNFAICDEQLFAIGEGTYPVASLFNHSCRPNAAVIFDGALALVKALENIQPGEEITLAYVDVAHARPQRKQALKEKYFFECQCGRCTDNNYLGRIDAMLGQEDTIWDRAQSLLDEDPTRKRLRQIVEQDWDLLHLTRSFTRRNDNVPDPTEPLTLPIYTHFMLVRLTPYLWAAVDPEIKFVKPSSIPVSQMRNITEFDDPPAASARPFPGRTYEEILTHALECVMSYKAPEDVVPYQISTLAKATRLFYDELMANRLRNATKLAMYIFVQYSIIYPPYHPMLAQHLLLLAKTAWNSVIQNELVTVNRRLEMVQERGIRRWILLAKHTILCTFGKQSNMWREVLELEWVFIREQKLKC